MLDAQLSMQTVNLVDFGLKLEPEFHFLVEGLFSGVILIEEDTLLVAEVVIVLFELLDLLVNFVVLMFVNLLVLGNHLSLLLKLTSQENHLSGVLPLEFPHGGLQTAF